MITIIVEGKEVEVSDDFKNLSPADQNATVSEIAKSMDISNPKNSAKPEKPRSMNVVNEGIARGLGAPVDLLSAGLDKIGIDTGDAPIGGSESIRSGIRAMGADPINRDPQSWGELALMGGGEALGTLLPMGAVSKLLQGGAAVAKGVGETLMRPFVATPVRAMGAEVAAGSGARVGGEVATKASGSDNPSVRMGGELAGGLIAAASPSATVRAGVSVAKALPVTGTVIRAGKSAVAPFTDAGARVRAENRMQGLVADPEAAARAIEADSIGNLTPAQRTNDPNLLALERTVMDSNPKLRDDLVARQGASAETLRKELRAPAKGAGVGDTTAFLEKRRESFRKGIASRLDAAQKRAGERIQKLDPARRESENAIIVREEIDNAYNSAASQERALWGRVPKNAKVETSNARRVYGELAKDTGRAREGDIPQEAKTLLGKGGFGSVETVREMHALYSQMRQRAREALSGVAPNENRARIANTIADAILEDLGATGGTRTAAGRTINEARAFSREINEMFGQGTVGSLTSKQRSGGAAVAPEAALASSVGVGGVRGSVAVDDIRRATGSNSDPALEDYLKGRLTDRAAAKGDYSPDRADAFTNANRETLQKFPELQGDIGAANAASRKAASQEARIGGIIKVLDNPRENVGAAFLAANQGDEIAKAVFKARNPVQAANALRRQAAKDPTGRALDGLKGGFLDNLIKRSSGGFDAQGSPLIEGNRLYGQLKDPKTRAALAQIFSPQELSRMDRVAREFQGLEGARSGRALNSVIDDAPNSVISFLSGTIAARQGAKLGKGTSGASLRTSSMATKKMKAIMDSLTNDRAEALIRDAITDKDLFVALMTRSTTPAARRMRETRLTEWLIGTAGVEASKLADE